MTEVIQFRDDVQRLIQEIDPTFPGSLTRPFLVAAISLFVVTKPEHIEDGLEALVEEGKELAMSQGHSELDYYLGMTVLVKLVQDHGFHVVKPLFDYIHNQGLAVGRAIEAAEKSA